MLNQFYIFSLTLILFSSKLHNQETDKNLDFIIMIDEKIQVGSLSNFQISTMFNNSKNIIKVSYYPGNLSLKESDFSKLISDTCKTIILSFNYSEYVGRKQNSHYYEIGLQKPWLKDYFNVLHIFNLDKKKYKKRFEPIQNDKNYTFELDSPSGTFRRVRHKG